MVEVMRRKPPAGERRRVGLTLVEVLVAMGILATGLMAVSAAQLYALRGTSSGRHTSDGSDRAEAQIERFQRMAWSDLAQTNWTPPGGLQLDNEIDTLGAPVVEQSYSLQWRITDTVAPTGQVFIKTIDVRVQWNEPNRPNRSFTITTIRHNDAAS